jgi:endo-1,4-beta-D-glucanase Y
MTLNVYYIKIEDEKGNVKRYLRFTNRDRAIQVYEYMLATDQDKGRVLLMDNEFNPLILSENDNDEYKF